MVRAPRPRPRKPRRARMSHARVLAVIPFGSLLLAALACGDGGASDDGDEGGTGDNAPLYALSTALFDDSGTTSYVAFLDALDDRNVTLDSAAEFPGWSS